MVRSTLVVSNNTPTNETVWAKQCGFVVRHHYRSRRALVADRAFTPAKPTFEFGASLYSFNLDGLSMYFFGELTQNNRSKTKTTPLRLLGVYGRYGTIRRTLEQHE